MFDFTLAFVLAIACSIPMVLIALAILLLSGPPVLFRQRRVGLHGALFTIYKFRTMQLGSAQAGPVTVAGDSRVTPLGRRLREYKLDELPQLWNVLRGDMSFVGPRPEVPEYASSLDGLDRAILDIRPGITGPATLAYRNEEQLLARQADPEQYNRSVIYAHKTSLNRAYLQRITFWSDFFWVVKSALPSGGGETGSTADPSRSPGRGDRSAY